MGLASHLGPWLLGTVKHTTGTTAGTVRNMGATSVVQTGATTVADTTAVTLFVLPAGAQILNFTVDVTTEYAGTTGNTITIRAGSTILGTVGGATTTPLAVGRQTFTITNANIASYVNVGSTDAFITATYACAGTASGGAAVVTCHYVVRLSDGVYAPNGASGYSMLPGYSFSVPVVPIAEIEPADISPVPVEIEPAPAIKPADIVEPPAPDLSAPLAPELPEPTN
jgi:hypothetical protein